MAKGPGTTRRSAPTTPPANTVNNSELSSGASSATFPRAMNTFNDYKRSIKYDDNLIRVSSAINWLEEIAQNDTDVLNPINSADRFLNDAEKALRDFRDASMKRIAGLRLGELEAEELMEEVIDKNRRQLYAAYDQVLQKLR